MLHNLTIFPSVHITTEIHALVDVLSRMYPCYSCYHQYYGNLYFEEKIYTNVEINYASKDEVVPMQPPTVHTQTAYQPIEALQTTLDVVGRSASHSNKRTALLGEHGFGRWKCTGRRRGGVAPTPTNLENLKPS